MRKTISYCRSVFLTSLVLNLALLCSLPPAQAQALTPAAPVPQPASASAQAAFERGAPVPAWVDQISEIPSTFSSAPVEWRLNDTYFYLGEQAATYIHRAIQVNDAATLARIGQTEITYQPDYQRVQLHQLRIRRGQQLIDKLADADIRFLRREPELDNGIYGGSVTAAIVINDVRVGDTLEFAYTTFGSNPVFDNRFFDGAGWRNEAPVGRRRITVDAPPGRTINYRALGPDGEVLPVARESQAKGRRVVRFEGQRLPAVVLEPYAPRDYQQVSWIQFSEFGSWKDVNAWATALFAVKPEDVVTLEAAGIAPGKLEDRISQALQFVQNDIRYLSVSLGENSHRPYPPRQVLERRYGDCKDKSLLLASLLRQLGVDAVPVLVPSYMRRGLDRMLPSPMMFDHVIVRAQVAGQVYYFDPTRLGQVGKIERMGQAHALVQVLPVAADTVALAEIPLSADNSLVTSTRRERVRFDKIDQPATMVVELSYAGVAAEEMRSGMTRVSPEQLRRFFEGDIGKRYPNAVLQGEPKIADDRVNNSMQLTLQFSVPSLAQANGANWTMQYQAQQFKGMFYMPDNPRRQSPVDVPSYPMVASYQLEVQLPEDYAVRTQTDRQSVKDAAFVLNTSASAEGRRLLIGQELSLLAPSVPAAQVPRFVGDLNKVGELMQVSFTLRPSDLKSAQAAAAQVERMPLKQVLQTRFESVIVNADKSMTQARSTGRDTDGMLCEKARAEAFLGLKEAALADARSLGDTAADNGLLLRCRAEVEWISGQFGRSEQDFSRAIVSGQQDGTAYLWRGLASFYQGRMDAAAADFTQSAQAARNPAEVSRAQAWLALAQRRAGKPAVIDSTASDENWPVALPAMLAGRKSPEALLRAAQNVPGDAGEAALAEAYFFVGQHYLLAGDKTRARLYFQHAVDKGVIFASAHLAARHELAAVK